MMGGEYSEAFYLRDQLNWKGILCGHKYPATTKSQQTDLMIY